MQLEISRFVPEQGFSRRVGRLVAASALNGLLAVGCGAFAAHGLTDPQAKAWVATGSQYQLAHAAAVPALLALLGAERGSLPAAALTLGAMIFGGALEAMALGAPRTLGAVAPVGGLLMLGGWALALVRALQRRA